MENEFERNEAMRNILHRNPTAFHPKVGKVSFSDEKSHYKGCSCKKIGCIKNYCECFEAKILCTPQCKCVDCFNCEERKGLRSFGDVTALKLLKEGTLRDMSYYRSEFMDKSVRVSLSGQLFGLCHELCFRLPFTLLTEEVVESIVQCLLAQAEEASITQKSSAETERMILEEFGHCTTQLIENSDSFKREKNLLLFHSEQPVSILIDFSIFKSCADVMKVDDTFKLFLSKLFLKICCFPFVFHVNYEFNDLSNTSISSQVSFEPLRN